MAIHSFGCPDTEAAYINGIVRKKVPWASLLTTVIRKLDMISYANDLIDLRSPPGNRLEKLKGNWAGWYSIRINSQWRVVFNWVNKAASDVQIVDYH